MSRSGYVCIKWGEQTFIIGGKNDEGIHKIDTIILFNPKELRWDTIPFKNEQENEYLLREGLCAILLGHGEKQLFILGGRNWCGKLCSTNPKEYIEISLENNSAILCNLIEKPKQQIDHSIQPLHKTHKPIFKTEVPIIEERKTKKNEDVDLYLDKHESVHKVKLRITKEYNKYIDRMSPLYLTEDIIEIPQENIDQAKELLRRAVVTFDNSYAQTRYVVKKVKRDKVTPNALKYCVSVLNKMKAP